MIVKRSRKPVTANTSRMTSLMLLISIGLFCSSISCSKVSRTRRPADEM